MTLVRVHVQDFEALTPNLLARTVETVEGGGMIILLLSSLSSLSKLYTMTMVSCYLEFATAEILLFRSNASFCHA